jgi:hypothetical protein
VSYRGKSKGSYRGCRSKRKTVRKGRNKRKLHEDQINTLTTSEKTKLLGLTIKENTREIESSQPIDFYKTENDKAGSVGVGTFSGNISGSVKTTKKDEIHFQENKDPK